MSDKKQGKSANHTPRGFDYVCVCVMLICLPQKTDDTTMMEKTITTNRLKVDGVLYISCISMAVTSNMIAQIHFNILCYSMIKGCKARFHKG